MTSISPDLTSANGASPADDPLLPLLRSGRPFALIRREERRQVEIVTGDLTTVATLADIPLPAGSSTLALVPFRQASERGFAVVEDGAPLLCLRIDQRSTRDIDQVLAGLPADPPRLRDGGFDLDDAAYGTVVERVVSDEIGRGEGSNFVIHRSYRARIDGDPLDGALAAFGRLLRTERGAYWTFCVHTGTSTFVGATPERHVSVDDGLIMMNPISGTYRHGPDGPDRDDLLRFLADQKEIDELFMVLDEELKMMAAVADLGGQVVGPYLKEMAHLTHTEYLLAGRGHRDVRQVLQRTMFAPTVVGSPIENACRVVARHEARGRGYYGGVLALLGSDGQGRQSIDAPILIRYAEFADSGELRVPVGATLVRHSVGGHEVQETYAKARGVLSALGVAPGGRCVPGGGAPDADAPQDCGLASDAAVQTALHRRNATLAGFWLEARDPGAAPLAPELAGRRVLVVDAEDTFTGMLTHQLRALGMVVTVRPYHEDPPIGGYDLVVAGPGPGDPENLADPRIGVLRRIVLEALGSRQPLLGICLGHQVLASVLGLRLGRGPTPYQGTQRVIDFFGRSERVGFYSTFTATAASSFLDTPVGPVRLARDATSHEVHALRGVTFASVPFHPESVLSEHGIDLLRDLIAGLFGGPPAQRVEPDGRTARPTAHTCIQDHER
ncbi:MAG: phenazine-specific anthranilate synthase [Dactylosporangium sp.]|nr:anthranilate synthase family protein [Dactylosporangium sp.]NNJ61723.1 phenazine-specific anthranilate synthase [Dactylosporangium sp.]